MEDTQKSEDSGTTEDEMESALAAQRRLVDALTNHKLLLLLVVWSLNMVLLVGGMAWIYLSGCSRILVILWTVLLMVVTIHVSAVTDPLFRWWLLRFYLPSRLADIWSGVGPFKRLEMMLRVQKQAPELYARASARLRKKLGVK